MTFAKKWLIAVVVLFLAGLFLLNPFADEQTRDFSEAVEPGKAVAFFDSNGSCRNCNLVFISVNVLRADKLGAYGYPRNVTPNLDALAKDGFVFENAFSQSGWTLPSYASLMTSLYPHVHGVEYRTRMLPDSSLTLAEILQIYGYNTGAFVSGNIDSGSYHGLSQGFEVFENIPGRDFKRLALKESPRISSAKKWILQNESFKEPFFLFLESDDLHCPYGPSYPNNPFLNESSFGVLNSSQVNSFCDKEYLATNITQGDVGVLNALYDWRLAREDADIGRLIGFLDKKNVLNRTLIVFFSPHGEEFYDHGFVGHQILYDTVLRVPLIIRVPNKKGGRRTGELVQLIDVMPTVLELLGIPINHQGQGKSAAAFIRGEKWAGNDYVFAEQEDVFRKSSPSPVFKWSVRSKNWKLVQREGKGELYNVQEDSLELSDLLQEKPKEVANLTRVRENFLDKTRVFELPRQSTTLSEEAIQNLLAYGYP